MLASSKEQIVLQSEARTCESHGGIFTYLHALPVLSMEFAIPQQVAAAACLLAAASRRCRGAHAVSTRSFLGGFFVGCPGMEQGVDSLK